MFSRLMGSSKTAAMASGTSARDASLQQGRSQTLQSFMDRMMGSTASTTAVGRLVSSSMLFCSRSVQVVSEVKTLAAPSLPNRMERLSKTASPVT